MVKTGKELQMMQKISEAFGKAAESKEMLNLVMDLIWDEVDVDYGCVLLKEKGVDKLQAVAERLRDVDRNFVVDGRIVEVAFDEKQVVVINDIDGYTGAGRGSIAVSKDTKSMLCVPLKSSCKILGIIYFVASRTNAFSREKCDLFDFLGCQIGMAIENINLYSDAEKSKRLSEAGQGVVNLSHGIKNVLQSVNGATEVVEFAFKTGKVKQALKSWQILKRNIETMKKFTLEMLEFSREQRPIFIPCRFNHIVSSAVESVTPEAKEKGISLVIDIDGKVPTIQADSDKLYDCVLNLLLNAIDAIGDGGGIIEIKTSYDEQNQQVALSVRDNGPGIREDEKEKIFMAFYSSKPKSKMSCGLGLSITRKIVAQHDGLLSVNSKPGGGAEFIITLPVKGEGEKNTEQ